MRKVSMNGKIVSALVNGALLRYDWTDLLQK